MSDQPTTAEQLTLFQTSVRYAVTVKNHGVPTEDWPLMEGCHMNEAILVANSLATVYTYLKGIDFRPVEATSVDSSDLWAGGDITIGVRTYVTYTDNDGRPL